MGFRRGMRRVVESASAASRITAQSGINRRIAAAGFRYIAFQKPSSTILQERYLLNHTEEIGLFHDEL